VRRDAGGCPPTNHVVTAGGGGGFDQTFGLIAGHESREPNSRLKFTFESNCVKRGD